ncbi:MAG: hypothetical protein J6U05_05570 [Neisseriaceae bacterium]|nr:hypothetical protein [Neisseriaceae bacterium]MBO7555380.1 hypothetical protein [Neisseriaceae bacterium]
MNDENPYEAPKSAADDIPVPEKKSPVETKIIVTLLICLIVPKLGFLLLLFWMLPISEEHKTRSIIMNIMTIILIIVVLWLLVWVCNNYALSYYEQ